MRFYTRSEQELIVAELFHRVNASHLQQDAKRAADAACSTREGSNSMATRTDSALTSNTSNVKASNNVVGLQAAKPTGGHEEGLDITDTFRYFEEISPELLETQALAAETIDESAAEIISDEDTRKVEESKIVEDAWSAMETLYTFECEAKFLLLLQCIRRRAWRL